MFGDQLDELKALLESQSQKHGQYVLAAGSQSSVYYDAKKVTFDARGSYLVGSVFYSLLQPLHVEAIGGLPIGADLIATSVALVSGLREHPIAGFAVREQQKTHGTMDKIPQAYAADGRDLISHGRRVVIVDDVATSGGSIAQALDAVEEAGAQVVAIAVLVDRQQGARKRFEDGGYKYLAIFEMEPDGKLRLADDVRRLLRVTV
jgi:orotate phosphoribosyltransferase